MPSWTHFPRHASSGMPYASVARAANAHVGRDLDSGDDGRTRGEAGRIGAIRTYEAVGWMLFRNRPLGERVPGGRRQTKGTSMNTSCTWMLFPRNLVVNRTSSGAIQSGRRERNLTYDRASRAFRPSNTDIHPRRSIHMRIFGWRAAAS